VADIPSTPGRTPEILSLEQPLRCDCEQNGLQVQVSAADFLLLHCPRCDSILAGRPITNKAGVSGVERITLGDEEAAQVRLVARLAPDAPLSEFLGLVLACTKPAALRVVQQRFEQRGELFNELRSALYGVDEPLRLLALTLIARMPDVPSQLRASALHAIQMTLLLEPWSQEVQLALMALYNLATKGGQLRSEVEQIRQRLQGQTHESADLTLRVADAVLRAMERAGAAAEERFAQDRARLATLVSEDKTAEARGLLENTYPEEDATNPEGGMSGRMALCEAAAKTLQQDPPQRAAARLLLSWALEYAETSPAAASSGGQRLSRMVAVNRLRDRMKRLK
jgi:hypothetical protein